MVMPNFVDLFIEQTWIQDVAYLQDFRLMLLQLVLLLMKHFSVKD